MTEEGHMEATTYDKFACFCKSKTDEKSEAIGEAETSVDLLTTRITNLQVVCCQIILFTILVWLRMKCHYKVFYYFSAKETSTLSFHRSYIQFVQALLIRCANFGK